MTTTLSTSKVCLMNGVDCTSKAKEKDEDKTEACPTGCTCAQGQGNNTECKQDKCVQDMMIPVCPTGKRRKRGIYQNTEIQEVTPTKTDR